MPAVIEDKDTFPLNFLEILLKNFNEIAWNKFENGDECRDIILNTLKHFNLDIEQADIFSQVSNLIASYKSDLHAVVHRLLNPQDNYKITIQWYKIVKEIGPGDCFGEMALIKQ